MVALLWGLVLLRRKPSEPSAMDAWRSMSAEAQEAHDNAVRDAAEAAEGAAARDAEAAPSSAPNCP